MSARAGGGRLLATPFATAIGMIALLGSIRNVVEPESLILRVAIGELAWVWSAVYGLGALLMLAGIARGRASTEAAGCMGIATGAMIQALVQLFFLDLSPYLTIWSSASLFLFAAAGLIRVSHLVNGRILVLTSAGE